MTKTQWVTRKLNGNGFAWNKGLKTGYNKKQADSIRGIKQTEEHKRKKIESRKGYRHSSETRKKISDSKRGIKSHFWRGGITEKNRMFRNSLDCRLWREAVFERDNWTCIWCGQRGGKLNADHIKPFSLFPELRLSIDNGRTLCLNCHKMTESYGKNYTEHERDNLGRFTKNY